MLLYSAAYAAGSPLAVRLKCYQQEKIVMPEEPKQRPNPPQGPEKPRKQPEEPRRPSPLGGNAIWY
ncbi:MAG: hypothetical protein ACOC46_00365, partial [Pirellulales bacterium]